MDYVPGTGYKIFQNRDLFSFGTDALILSAYFKPKGNVLDLGTGNGIIPLRLCDLKQIKSIVGYELQEDAFELAKQSVDYNNLTNKILLHNEDIHSIENSYRPASFNSVITNPPYFSGGIKNYSESKSISRHMDSIDSWIRIASRMLVPEGYFYTMNRPENLIDVVCSMRDNHLEPKTICFVKNRCNDEPFLFLISGRKNGRPNVRIQKDLILYENDIKTDEFNKLYNLET